MKTAQLPWLPKRGPCKAPSKGGLPKAFVGESALTTSVISTGKPALLFTYRYFFDQDEQFLVLWQVELGGKLPYVQIP